PPSGLLPRTVRSRGSPVAPRQHQVPGGRRIVSPCQFRAWRVHVPQIVDFTDVSTIGLQSSPVAEALAGLRANEARYFKNKYDHVFTVDPAHQAMETVHWVHGILKDERDIVISARPLEAT